jgi:V8-like Glu-specific endopeptidase
MSGGDPSEGRVYRVAPDGILEQSPVKELDFVLLQVEDKIVADDALSPAPLADDVPPLKSALNLLHHPGKDTMKLSTSADGVTGVYSDRGLIQYATKAVGGSSGSPCFNDEWKVVALHHAARATTFGSIREGVLIQPIRDRIEKYLET